MMNGTTTVGDAAERTCALCGAGGVSTFEHRHTFRYGSGDAAADLTVDLPVRRCEKCGFEFLDRESEEIKLNAICKHLGVLPPSGTGRTGPRGVPDHVRPRPGKMQ